MAHIAKSKPVEVWFQSLPRAEGRDEMRLGQKNGLVRQWARRGSRPRRPADQRYESATLFGAIYPARGTDAALAMPHADTEAMQRHLDEIARTVKRRSHAVLLLDRAVARPRRVAHHRQPRRAQDHDADLPALAGAGAEPS